MNRGYGDEPSGDGRGPTPWAAGGGRLNPWTAMFTRPRAAARQMMRTDRMAGLAVVPAVLSGINMALGRALVGAVGQRLELSALLLLCAVVGGLAGLVGLYAGAALVHWTGGRLGGRGTTDDVRNAWGWGNAPHAWGLLLYAPAVLLLRRDLFRGVGRAAAAGGLLGAAAPTLAAAELALAAWSLVAFLQALAEAQQFSAGRALAGLALAWLIVLAAAVPLYALLIL